MKYILALMFLGAFLLQIATLGHPAIKYCQMAKSGKRVLAAGLLIIAICLAGDISYYLNNTLYYMALFLISLGLLFTGLERLIHPQDYTFNRRKGDEDDIGASARTDKG